MENCVPQLQGRLLPPHSDSRTTSCCCAASQSVIQGYGRSACGANLSFSHKTLRNIRFPNPRIPSPVKSFRVRAVDISWQSTFLSQGFEPEKLLAEAPFLLKLCEDLDWKKQAEDLRKLALLSLRFNEETGDDDSIAESPDLGQSVEDARDDDRDNNGGLGPNGCGPWFTAGAALAALLLPDGVISSAFAEESVKVSDAAEVTSRVPGWLGPAVLAFPVVSYVLFNLYRDQVNPYAKVTDWMFGVVAVVIVANLILISTIGVRLY